MTKVVIVSRNLDFKGGVVNFVRLLLNNLDENEIESIHFVEGKSPKKHKNILLPFSIISQLYRFRRLIKKEKPDVIHLNPSLGSIPMLRDGIFLRIAKKNKVPVLFFIHGWKEEFYQDIRKGLLSGFHMRSLDRADAIVVLAHDFKEKLVSIGINEEKIHVLTTMVESRKYKPKEKDFNPPHKILFCSRMVKEKGPYELLETVPLVIDKYPDTEFIFMGDGPELENIENKAHKLGIEDRITFTGYVSEEKKLEIFKKSHIFVFPTYYGEGFPTVVLEAMAAGMPVITTKNAGLKRAFKHGSNGYFLSSMPADPKEIASYILKLIANQKTMEKISKYNMIEVQEKYDVKAVTKNIEEIYHSIR